MKMNNEEFSNMINWDKLMEKSNNFKNQKPFNFSFIEEFFNQEWFDLFVRSGNQGWFNQCCPLTAHLRLPVRGGRKSRGWDRICFAFPDPEVGRRWRFSRIFNDLQRFSRIFNVFSLIFVGFH